VGEGRNPETHISFNKIVPPNSRAQKVLIKLSSAAFCPGGGGGRLEGRFFFSSCIWCGEWTMDFPCKFYLGAGGGWWRIYFPFSQWEGPRCLAFIPFKFGGWVTWALLLFLLSLGGG